MKHDVTIEAGGVACIRLVNLPPRSKSILQSEFGQLTGSPMRDRSGPWVTAVVERVKVPVTAGLVGRSTRASSTELFMGEGGSWARVEMDGILDGGRPCVVTCDPGYDIVRLVGYVLEPLARVRALLQGHVFVHSSAVALNGVGCLFPAWGNTGKTNLMLQLSLKGGAIVADDWSLLLADGMLAGYPRPVNLLNYNFDAFPEFRPLLSWKGRLALVLDRRFRSLRERGMGHGALMLRLGDVAGRALEILSNTRLPLGAAGPMERRPLELGMVAELHKVDKGSVPVVQPITASELARRSTVCFAFEHARFLQRLAEYAYLTPAGSRLCHDILSLYQEKLEAVLARLRLRSLHSLAIPERPSRLVIGEIAQRVLDLLPNER